MKHSADRIVFVSGMHGNEYMPTLALASQNIPQLVANPRALSIGKRTVDSDLNAAFGKPEKDYETKRAKEILKQIPKDAQVVDFHTSNSADTPFVIVTDLKMLSLARQTGLRNVVYMKHNIKKGHALINHRDGISIETGKHAEPASFNTTLRIVETLQNRKESAVSVYEAYGRITEPGEYKNFKHHKNGFYPIFVGETSYDFIGLKARRLDI